MNPKRYYDIGDLVRIKTYPIKEATGETTWSYKICIIVRRVDSGRPTSETIKTTYPIYLLMEPGGKEHYTSWQLIEPIGLTKP